MKKVQREEIIGPAEYEAMRDDARRTAMAAKALRRVHLGEHLTFLFENAETVRYQVQEMLRIEKRTSEDDVLHELATYNELLGDAGELGCTLMIEIEDVLQRDIVMRKWLDLPRHLYLKRPDDSLARATFDERQVGDDRLSAVQYLRFPVGDAAPVAIGVDLPGLELEVELHAETRKALAEDLAGG